MALTLLATNNAESVLASAISATDTSLIVSAGTGAEFPDAVAGESYFKLTITDAATGSQVEIVNVTAKAGDIFTIERAQEGTLARAWAANDMVANMMTADTLNVIADFANQAASSAQEAQEYANNASEYAQNKFTFFKTPSDPDGTIAGLAATTNDQSFWVAQGPDALSAAWQYQNKGGVAVLQAKQPGTAAITGTVREFPTLAAAQADADAGNILNGGKCWVTSDADVTLADEYINNAGTLVATGRKMPSAMPTGYQSATAVSSAANTVAITIPGLLVDGSLIYFLSPILNTGAVNVTVTDAKGNSVVRAIQKQNNAALVGNELLLNQPVLMEFRTGTANNFVLVASGPVASELNARLLSLELNSLTIVSSVAASADAYTGVTANTTSSQVLVTGRAFVFTPSATNTTRTPTLSLNGWTPRTIKQAGGTALAVGDLVSGNPCFLMYNAASSDFRLLTYPGDRVRILNAYTKGTVTSDSASPNAVSVTIPGLLGDGTQITFEPVVANTGATTLVITDLYGNSVTRNLLKGANTALTGGELQAAKPATVQYRSSPVNNFKLLYSGDPTTEIINLGKSITALQGAVSDPLASLKAKLVTSPFGNISFSAGVRTITPNQIICTSIGSSIGVGAGSSDGSVYAPNAQFVDQLKKQLKFFGNLEIINDNQCVPTTAISQFSAQLDASPYATSDFVLIVAGMNDAPVANFNAGETYPGAANTLDAIIDKCLARGAIPIVCTSPHNDVTKITYALPNGVASSYPIRTFNVSTSFVFDPVENTITQNAFANSLYGGNILKPGDSLKVGSGPNAGTYTIASISTDRRVVTVNQPIPAASSATVNIMHVNMDMELVLEPPPSESVVTRDWTGSGVEVSGDVRFWMSNNSYRSSARNKNVYLADCESSFMRGVETVGWSGVYIPANYNHFNDYGYTAMGKPIRECANFYAQQIYLGRQVIHN
ncbi:MULTISPECIES: SGNH/GDSL hydrolase family protein [unclassified Raoultella]|uniref:SGNH/GDSL hydrolase family protein n=1 Tax=unclassified Raoultella TaxID=2627600 RepID=UPI001D10EA1D